MGIESYLLRLGGNHETESVSRDLTSTLGFKPDPDQYAMTGYSYHVYRDGHHVIECEVADRSTHCHVSLRFALCNPPSIDKFFIDVAAELMSRFHLTAVVCEHLPTDAPTQYDASNILQFTANCK